VTKGDHEEQHDKLLRSGLGSHFAAVEVLREKNSAAYLEIASRLGLARESTWMIGNSPRSDVNPALEAGLHAAYVRYHNTWILEEEELREPPPGQHLLVCDNFAEAAAHLLG
jgi:putative hydrolase of the HAD superfamily